MAWNKSSENGEAVSRPLQKRSGGCFPVRGFVAGVIVALGGVAALVFFALRTTPGTPSSDKHAPKRITEVKPSVASNAVAAVDRKKNDGGVPEGYVRASNGVLHPKGIPYNPKWTHAHKVHTNGLNRAGKDEPVPFRNATEQLMYQLFSCRLGKNPPPLIRLPQQDRKELLAILLDKNPVDPEKDSEKMAVGKETIQQAKNELKKFLKQGGNVDDFFKYYHHELQKAYEKRQMALDEIRRINEEEGDNKLAAQMREEVNKRLKEEGIMQIGSHVVRPPKNKKVVSEGEGKE